MRSLKGHGHWVNSLALSTEYALRTGAYDHTATAPADAHEAKTKALARHALPTHPACQCLAGVAWSELGASGMAWLAHSALQCLHTVVLFQT